MADESVHCVVTSPPYWGLRDYGADGQIGLEKTPQEYVAKMVEVFRDVRRVLRKDGTCWVNLGDTYAAQGGDHGKYGNNQANVGAATCHANGFGDKGARTAPNGLKPKDLVGIPWRVAFALQEDGWWLRQDIIWAKPNPMPESVTDRCTKAHEYLFLLTKSAKYYYNADAIKEDSITGDERIPYGSQGAWDFDGRPVEQRHGGELRLGREGKNSRMHQDRGPSHPSSRKVRSPAGWKTGAGSHGSVHEDGREQAVSYVEIDASKRNKRSVWTIATEPFPEAHFATYPQKLVEPCILAGCPAGGVVLDPFSGSGTTGVVALRLGRSFVGIELNRKYAAMSRRRITRDAPLLNQEEEVEGGWDGAGAACR